MPVKELKLNLKPHLKKFEVFTKKNITADLTGGYVAAIRGKGLEFDGYRVYSINDDASQIDWKATLRSQQTLVKRYVEERNLSIMILFDVSNSMLYGSTDKMKAEYAAEIVSSLSFSALQSGDFVGLMMFNDKIVSVIPQMMGTKQYYTILSKLSDPQVYGGQKDLEYTLKFLIGYLQRRSIVIIVSDFLGLKGDWERLLSIATKKFDMMAIVVRDPNDETIPGDVGQIVVQDPFSDDQIAISSRGAKEGFNKLVAEQNRKLESIFKKNHVQALDLSTNKPFETPIITFFKHKMGR